MNDLLSAEIDLEEVDRVRQQIPVFEDRRPDAYLANWTRAPRALEIRRALCYARRVNTNQTRISGRSFLHKAPIPLFIPGINDVSLGRNVRLAFSV